MLIRFLEVEDFRGVRGPVKLELGPGINVWHGPNEVGKSTLVDALRAVLVLPAKSSSDTHKAMATRGGDKAPRVAVGFRADDGTEVTVQKSFGANGKVVVELREPGGSAERLEADRADEALRAMLRVGPASRGSVNDPGPFGLVFVAQGASRANPSVSDSTRVLLREQLAALTSELIAGPESLELLARAKERHSVHFTDGGAEKSSKDAPLAAARARERSALEATSLLAAKRRSLDVTFDEADATATELDRLTKDIPGLEARANDARVGVEGLVGARRSVQSAERSFELARVNAERPIEERQRRTAHRIALEAAAAAVDAADSRFRGSTGSLDDHLAAKPELEKAAEGAAAALRDAEIEKKRAAARARIGARERDLVVVSERLGRAREIEAKQEELREIERGIDAGLADAIASAAEDLAEAERRLESASATLRIHLTTPRSVSVDGRSNPVDAESPLELRVASPTTISIGDVATIAIDPGGEELPAIRASLEGLRSSLARRLADAGVDSPAAARSKDQARSDAVRELTSLDRELGVVAKDGIPALTATRVELESQLAEALAELETHDGLRPPPDASVAGLERTLRDVEVDLERRRSASSIADLALGRHRERATELRAAAATAASERQAAERDHERVARDLDDHVARFGDDATLDETVRRLTAARGDALAELDRSKEALAAMQPDALDRELESATKALEYAMQKRVALERDLAVLRGRLEDGDAIGLDDRLAKAREDEAASARERAAIELDAAASKLLFETLTKHKNESESRFRAPLERKVRELLGLVLGDAKLSIDDQSLTVAQLDRGDHRADGFDQLSSGAQEQLGVIVRLAMAELLAADGILPVTLDDALVFTDERRFQGMRQVLERVAEHLQIVFVTCQWERYRALGLVADVEVDLGRLLGDPTPSTT